MPDFVHSSMRLEFRLIRSHPNRVARFRRGTIGDTKVNLGPFATLFGHGCGFFDDRKAWGRGPDPAFGPARRFSACFGRVGGCAQGGKNWSHGPADLLGGRRTR